MSDVTQPVPRKRDPEGRRRAILSAAAEILLEEGASALTHRAVAGRAGVALGSTTRYFASIDDLREEALGLLADEIDAELEDLREVLGELRTAPERAAAATHEFLLDRRQVQANVALTGAGAVDPSRRELAARWFDSLVDMMAEHVGRERATALAVFLDGATVHAGLHDTPLSAEAITRTIRAIVAMETEEHV